MAYTRTAHRAPPAGSAPTADARPAVARTLVGGLVAGAVAGMAMAMWTMLAGASYSEFGAFTPMYLMAAPFGAADDARRSLAAAPGDAFVWSTGPALLGAAIHMANSMMLGVVFAAVARAVRLGRGLALPAGIVFGVAALALMTFVTAPSAGALFGGEPFVAEIADIVGWGTWIAGHLVFGAVLGLWPVLRPGDVAPR